MVGDSMGNYFSEYSVKNPAFVYEGWCENMSKLFVSYPSKGTV